MTTTEQNPTEKALEFIESVQTRILDVKPESTLYEIIGTVYLILNRTIEYELQKTSSSNESEKRVGARPQQIQSPGIDGGEEESPEGVRDQQRVPKTSNRSKFTNSGKKRRR